MWGHGLFYSAFRRLLFVTCPNLSKNALLSVFLCYNEIKCGNRGGD